MLDDEIVTVPAGWYPDPMGLPQLRWWDNYAWTEFTSAARTPLIMQDEPRLAYADDDLPSRRSQREQREQGGMRSGAGQPADLASTLRQLEPPKPQNVERNQPAPTMAEPAPATPTAQEPKAFNFEPERHESAAPTNDSAYDPFAEFLTTPAAPQETRATANPRFGEQVSFDERAQANEQGFDQQEFAQQGANFPQQGSARGNRNRNQDQRGYGETRIGMQTPLAYTPFVWLIAMIPLIQLVGILLVVSAVDITLAMPFLLGIVIAPYIVTIPLAIADRSNLIKMGHHHPAHWAWSILTAPAYLVARAIAASREYGKGLTPLLVWASLSLLQVVSIIAVPGILISAAPAVFSADVEDSIEAYSAIAGRQLTVECPATPPTQIGGTFNCDGVEVSTGDKVGIVVRLQRANGWIDWRVYGMVWEKDNAVASVPETPVAAEDETVGS